MRIKQESKKDKKEIRKRDKVKRRMEKGLRERLKDTGWKEKK
jgi:hypothetical protein